MEYEDFMGIVTMDVVSRFATRRLLINGSEKQLRGDWNDKYVEVFDPLINKWENINYKSGKTQEGYNPNIGKRMYVGEIEKFINAVAEKERFINYLENDHCILNLFYSIEESYNTGSFVTIQ